MKKQLASYFFLTTLSSLTNCQVYDDMTDGAADQASPTAGVDMSAGAKEIQIPSIFTPVGVENCTSPASVWSRQDSGKSIAGNMGILVTETPCSAPTTGSVTKQSRCSYLSSKLPAEIGASGAWKLDFDLQWTPDKISTGARFDTVSVEVLDATGTPIPGAAWSSVSLTGATAWSGAESLRASASPNGKVTIPILARGSTGVVSLKDAQIRVNLSTYCYSTQEFKQNGTAGNMCMSTSAAAPAPAMVLLKDIHLTPITA